MKDIFRAKIGACWRYPDKWGCSIASSKQHVLIYHRNQNPICQDQFIVHNTAYNVAAEIHLVIS